MNTLQLNKRITGGNNALNILQNVASLGSTIRNNSDVSNSGMMTGQELRSSILILIISLIRR